MSEGQEQQIASVSSPEPLSAELQEIAGDLTTGGCVRAGRPELLTTPEILLPLLNRLHELPEPYSRLTDLCGVDWGDRVQVVYALCRGYGAEMVLVKVDLPRAQAAVPTVTGLWQLAFWPEREVAEMFGVTFVGHPNCEHLLLPEGFVGYPLLKDYEYDRSNPLLSPDPLREDPDAVLGGPPSEDETGAS